MNDIIKEIQSKIKSKIFVDYNMGKSTWFRTGGNAQGYTIIDNIKDLKAVISYSDKIKFYIIGAGSNLLVRDKGFKGIVIKLGKNFNKINIKGNVLSVGSSVLDINLSKFAIKNSIRGFEFFRSIPGTIGGAIKMNAGCYESQTADNLKRILIINALGNLKYIDVENLNLKYRSSNIDNKSIILEADFNFEYGSKHKIEKKTNEIKLQREISQPIKEKTSGSTFKNPSDRFAAKLIEQAGCKGTRIGGASISTVHANFIINDGSASANDIENLGNKIIKKVKDKFGVVLEWEIKIIGI